ncbi:hypothetical protein Tco_0816299 [Tanacetum coccineum]
MSPTKSLLDVGSRRISIFIVSTFVSLGCSGNTMRIMRRTLKILLVITVSLQQSVVSLSYPSTNKAFQVLEDSPCLKSFLYGKHKLLAPVNIFPCLKPCVQTRIYPVDLEFLDLVVQCLINLLQSAVTENLWTLERMIIFELIFIPKCGRPVERSIFVKSCLNSKPVASHRGLVRFSYV